jgi:hypothetical protein
MRFDAIVGRTEEGVGHRNSPDGDLLAVTEKA